MMAKKKSTTSKASRTTTKANKRVATKKTATQKSPGKKLSALDAAAKVLAEAKQPLSTGQLIEQMAAKGYWRSPGGQTPSATLFAAIAREIKVKGKQARFRKVDRGLFALNSAK